MTRVLGVVRIEVAVFHNTCIVRQTAADMAAEGLEAASIHADSESEQTIEAQVLQIII